MWYIEAKMQNAGSCKIYETFGNLKCTKVCGKLENTEFTEKCGNAKYGNDQTSINAPLGFIQYFAHRSFDVNNWQYALYISLQKINDLVLQKDLVFEFPPSGTPKRHQRIPLQRHAQAAPKDSPLAARPSGTKGFPPSGTPKRHQRIPP